MRTETGFLFFFYSQRHITELASVNLSIHASSPAAQPEENRLCESQINVLTTGAEIRAL